MDSREELKSAFHDLSAHMGRQIKGTEENLGWNEVTIMPDETGEDKVTVYIDPGDTVDARLEQSEELFQRAQAAKVVSSVRFIVAEPAELQ